jgi:ribosomal protein S18 acetylase RimI-like enzyme
MFGKVTTLICRFCGVRCVSRMSQGLRPPQPEEIHSIASWAIAEGWPGLTKLTALNVAEFPEILKLPGHSSYCLAEPNAAAIGFGQIWVSESKGVNLVRIIINPELRSRGFGKLLSKLLLAEAKALHPSQPVKLRVARSNLPAVAVYGSLGFSIVASESNEHVYAMAAG